MGFVWASIDKHLYGKQSVVPPAANNTSNAAGAGATVRARPAARAVRALPGATGDRVGSRRPPLQWDGGGDGGGRCRPCSVRARRARCARPAQCPATSRPSERPLPSPAPPPPPDPARAPSSAHVTETTLVLVADAEWRCRWCACACVVGCRTPHSLLLDPQLHGKLGQPFAQLANGGPSVTLTPPDAAVADFFINLAVCNTVVPQVLEDGRFVYQVSQSPWLCVRACVCVCGICICLDTSAGPEPSYRAYQMSRSTKASEPKHTLGCVCWGRRVGACSWSRRGTQLRVTTRESLQLAAATRAEFVEAVMRVRACAGVVAGRGGAGGGRGHGGLQARVAQHNAGRGAVPRTEAHVQGARDALLRCALPARQPAGGLASWRCPSLVALAADDIRRWAAAQAGMLADGSPLGATWIHCVRGRCWWC